MKKDENKKVIIGKIGAPFGVKGWVKIFSYTAPKENITKYKTLYFQINRSKNWEKLSVEKIKKHGNNFIAKVKDFDDKDSAATLTNANIATLRSDLEKLDEGEYYWHDLIGLEVFNEKKEFLGHVVELFDTTANDILVVQNKNKEYLIPFILDIHILKVDQSSNKIIVNWELEE